MMIVIEIGDIDDCDENDCDENDCDCDDVYDDSDMMYHMII